MDAERERSTPRWAHAVGLAFAAAVLAIVYMMVSSCGCSAATLLSGRVVGVLDGDTIAVLDASRTEHRIRLAGIDAPEKGQAYGQRAREHLSDLVFGRSVSAECPDTDRYGRSICRVRAGGIDVNAEMLRAGYAWVYRKYAQDATLYRLEESARARRAGLWAEPAPTPPWEWRKAH